MEPIFIPLASVDDAESLMALFLDAFTLNMEVYGHYPPETDSLGWHRDQIKNNYCHKIVRGSELVGGIYLIPHEVQEMKIDFIFIETRYHGNKIGSKVMSLIELQYPEVTKWFLYTPYKDYKNHNFYEKHGYTKTSESNPIEGSDFTLFMYEKGE